jgi:hypothetical protein
MKEVRAVQVHEQLRDLLAKIVNVAADVLLYGWRPIRVRYSVYREVCIVRI